MTTSRVRFALRTPSSRPSLSQPAGRSWASHSASTSRFRPLSINATPRRISAIDTTLMNERSSSRLSSHCKACVSGRGLVTSERTFVAGRSLTAGDHAVRRAAVRDPDRHHAKAIASETLQGCPCARSSAAIPRPNRSCRKQLFEREGALWALGGRRRSGLTTSCRHSLNLRSVCIPRVQIPAAESEISWKS